MRPTRQVAGLLLDEAPTFQLSIYSTATVITRSTGLGWSSYLVDGGQAAEVLGAVPVSSGLLAPDILATGRARATPYFVWLARPRPVTIGIRFGHMESATFCIPPLVWAGCGADYRLVALHPRDLDPAGWPRGADIPLYKAPFGNVFTTTGICWGTGDRPRPATAAGMAAAFEVFLTGSYFNANEGRERSIAHPANILLRYETLDAETPYPCDDLMHDGRTLNWLLSGGPWR
jgi:hypothetical protein